MSSKTIIASRTYCKKIAGKFCVELFLALLDKGRTKADCICSLGAVLKKKLIEEF